jgi:hypothetical protein
MRGVRRKVSVPSAANRLKERHFFNGIAGSGRFQVYVSGMSPGRATLGALLCAWLLACGERAGDPVVRVDLADAGGSGGSGGQGGATPMPTMGGAPESEPETEPGPTGLCGACDQSNECGDGNDVCIRHDGRSFCGRDCEEGFGCPDDYHCVDLNNSQLRQCVPIDACPGPVEPPPDLASVRAYLLSRINTVRIAQSNTALEASNCLDGLAQSSAVDYAFSGQPLGKYADECDPIWPDCECNWNAQAEVAVAHYGLDWLDSIERALRDDRFARAVIEFEVTYVGIGFWISGDEAWIALSFS